MELSRRAFLHFGTESRSGEGLSCILRQSHSGMGLSVIVKRKYKTLIQ